MGMFDKDKEIGNRIDTEFEIRETFILWGVSTDYPPVETKIGPANKTTMQVSRMDTPDMIFECSSLGSAIHDKAAEAEPEDFPCLVQLRKVASRFGNDALVLQFIGPFKAGIGE